MTVFLWICIILLFILSFVGLVVPIIPSVLVLWGGFLIYYFGIDRESISLLFWIIAIILTLLILVADFIANQFFVKKYGGSKWGERMAVIGVIIGAFIYPPFGIIIVPFVFVFVTEMIIEGRVDRALKVALASFLAFLSSTLAKGLIQLVMIAFFLFDVLIRAS